MKNTLHDLKQARKILKSEVRNHKLLKETKDENFREFTHGLEDVNSNLRDMQINLMARQIILNLDLQSFTKYIETTKKRRRFLVFFSFNKYGLIREWAYASVDLSTGAAKYFS